MFEQAELEQRFQAPTLLPVLSENERDEHSNTKQKYKGNEGYCSGWYRISANSRRIGYGAKYKDALGIEPTIILPFNKAKYHGSQSQRPQDHAEPIHAMGNIPFAAFQN